MLKSQKIVKKLNQTYFLNISWYNLRRTPLIGKLFNATSVKKRSVRFFVKVISSVFLFIKDYAFKSFYCYGAVFLANTYLLFFENIFAQNDLYRIMLLLIILLICFLGTGFYDGGNPGIRYSVKYLKADAKKTILINYFIKIFKSSLMFLFVALTFELSFNFNFMLNDFMSILFISLIYFLFNIIISTISLYGDSNTLYSTKTKKSKKIGVFCYLVLFLLIIILGYLFISKTIDFNIPNLLIISTLLSLLTLLCLIFVLKYKYFLEFYKKVEIDNKNGSYRYYGSSNYNSYSVKRNEKESINKNNISRKKAYDFLEDAFIKRYDKSNLKSIYIIFFSEVAFLLLVVIVATMLPQYNTSLVSFFKFPYFIYYLYISGTTINVITRNYFVNCDFYLLQYGFYKKPTIILKMFLIRLKTLLKYSTFQNLPVFVFLPILLFVTKTETTFEEYVVIFLTLFCVSIFFTIYYLFGYYIFQPFTRDLKQKSLGFFITNILVYLLIYNLAFNIYNMFNQDIFKYGLSVLVLTIVFTIVALIVVRKYATKTFRLK